MSGKLDEEFINFYIFCQIYNKVHADQSTINNKPNQQE